MKVNILYEENIRNGHKVYTTYEIPDGDYSIMLDLDYERRLEEADPDKRDKVRRCNTVQEMFDLMNESEYNNSRKLNRHLGNYQGQAYEDDGTGDSDETGATWNEPLMTEVADPRIFMEDELNRDREAEHEAVCDWIREVLQQKPDWADMFIAIRIDGEPIRHYAARNGVSENSITQKLKRAVKKLKENFENRQI